VEPEVIGLVLAGGESRRMQALAGQPPEVPPRAHAAPVHKALVDCAGKPLLDWVLERLRPQVSRLLIGCGPSAAPFAAWNLPCVPDQETAYRGPLAGVQAALHWAALEIDAGRLSAQSMLISVPCDMPFLPADTVSRLLHCLQLSALPLVVAHSAHRAQWAVTLMRLGSRDQLRELADACLARGHRNLARGQGSLEAWCRAAGYRACTWDETQAFANVNTPEDLAKAEKRMLTRAMHDELAAFAGGAVPVATLRAVLLRCLQPVAARSELTLEELSGHVAADPVIAPFAVPAEHNAAMDGYALRSSDLASTRLLARARAPAILAGHPLIDPPDAAPAAVRIMTGGVLPPGFDTVLAQEHATWRDDLLCVPPGLAAGANVRLRGEDLQPGDTVLTPGSTIGPAEVGMLASLGIGRVAVRAPLRVALISTGDELIDPLQAASPGPVARGSGLLFDSNRYCLRALLGQWPAVQLTDLGLLPDRSDALEECLQRLGNRHDLILSSGGVSAGEADVVRSTLHHLADLSFCAVAMRPGKPFAVGSVGQALYCGLPGNPVAAALSFCVFVAPAIDRLLGRTPRGLPLEVGRASRRLRKKPMRTEFLRAALSVDPAGTVWVDPAPYQGSGILSSLSRYPALAVMEHDRAEVEEGEELPFVRLMRLFGVGVD